MNITTSSSNPNRGLLALRFVKSLATAKGRIPGAIAFASGQNWRNSAEVVGALKAIVTANDIGDATGLLHSVGVDFAELLRGLTIIGRLPLRRAPLRVRMISTTAGSGASWIGESQPAPLSRVALAGSELDALKVCAVVVSTTELLRSATPDAESFLARDMSGAMAAALDVSFINRENAGVAGVEPAGIANGITPIASTGSTLAAIDSDLARVIEALTAAGSTLNGATWVMLPRTALYLARLRGSGGALAYPGMGAKGGELLGIPAITSANVPFESGSPSGQASITLLDTSEILLGDEGDSALEVAEEASLQMLDNPTNNSGTGTATTMVSMWQTNSCALKLTRYANWRARRAGMAQVLSGVTY